MKEVKLIFCKEGRIKIYAEGQKGKGTEIFTEQLAKELGTIEERHKGHHYIHEEETLKALIR